MIRHVIKVLLHVGYDGISIVCVQLAIIILEFSKSSLKTTY